jgi:hypothetical protein
MVRAAGVALVLVSGCTVPEYFSVSYWQRDSSGQTSGVSVARQAGSYSGTLAGSPDVVAQRFRQALAQLGMQAQVMADAEGIKINTMSRSGKQLSVALKRVFVEGAEKTEVQMQWAAGSDAEVEQQLLRLVVGARN